MKKFLHFDWLRAVQFLENTVPKKEIQCQKITAVTFCSVHARYGVFRELLQFMRTSK